MLKQLYPFYSVIRREHGDPLIEELNPGDALEPEGRGTGKAPEGFSSSAQHSSQPWGGRIKNSGSQSHPQVRIGKSPGPGDRRQETITSSGLLGEGQDLWAAVVSVVMPCVERWEG